MRILFLSPRQCWPMLSGAKLREYHFARALGRHADVTYLHFAQPGLPQPTAADMPFCRKIVPVPAPRPYTPANIARGFLGRWPLPVLNYTSAEMKARLAGLLRSEPFDMVHIDHINMAAYVPLLRNATRAPVAYNWHNIESELMRRYGANAPSPAHRLYAAWTARRLAALERRVLREGFGHVVCSERERAQLLRLFPQARIAAIENGVDTAFFAERGAAAGRHRLVFVGAMSYHANIEASIRFVRTVWPRVRERFPSWRLTLVGANPTPAVVALGNQAGVEVTGTVADVRPYYREAVAAIVPLRTAGGTRLKILEAMAAGVPVVSSTLGAEGLAVVPGEHLLIADQEEDWPRQLAALAAPDDLWQRLAGAGRELVRAHYDWEGLGEALYETYLRWWRESGSRVTE